MAPPRERTDPLASSFATTYAGVVAFIAVVAEGSFAGAADRLGIGRSAVSRSVQRLEDQLNVRLFLRSTRSTTLTREGDIFYASCHAGVNRLAQAVEEIKDLRGGPPRGHLRISATTCFGRKVVVAPIYVVWAMPTHPSRSWAVGHEIRMPEGRRPCGLEVAGGLAKRLGDE